ncbi:MAG: SET domain-containing protein [Chromatiales bacterium]|nr:SET domain-containing protein [Chromatiales bacterium]
MPSVKLSELFYVEESMIHGKGLFAKCIINKGDYMGTYRGPLCYDMESGGPHVLWVEDDDGVWIGRDGRNILRYMNHHATPCAAFDGFDLYALRDIHQGNEITIHYGDEFVEAIGDEYPEK